jgi:cysteine desulfuration protein SufE
MTDCTSCLQKQEELKNLFKSSQTPEEQYLRIIDLGKTLPEFPREEKIEQNLVTGCQSLLYVTARHNEGKIFFKCFSEALISAGLAALLLRVYNGEEPLVLIKCPPHFLQTLGISASLSPSRSNGVASLFLRMQQEAIKIINLQKF